MKSLKSAYFFVGMTGMFSMAVPNQMDWLVTLPATQSSVLAVGLAVVCAAILTWLAQFRRRHIGSPALLQGFAVCGAVTAAILPVKAFVLLPLPAEDSLIAILRLVLVALFCCVAIRTRPDSEHTEDAF
jgi:hypothetical protein